MPRTKTMQEFCSYLPPLFTRRGGFSRGRKTNLFLSDHLHVLVDPCLLLFSWQHTRLISSLLPLQHRPSFSQPRFFSVILSLFLVFNVISSHPLPCSGASPAASWCSRPEQSASASACQSSSPTPGYWKVVTDLGVDSHLSRYSWCAS